MPPKLREASHRSSEPVDFLEAQGVRVRRQVPGSSLTTFAIGGPLTLVEPRTRAELLLAQEALAPLPGAPAMVGCGSNTVFPDRGLAYPVMRLGGEFKEVVELDGTSVYAGAAASLMRLARTLSGRGLKGLEFASGIPGSLGGAVVMNAGAHGDEIKDIIEEVEVLLPSGQFVRLKAADICFTYRRAHLPDGAIVVGATLRLVPECADALAQRRIDLLEMRKRTQPLALPCAGSIFKNPYPESAGRLLERAGLKGTRVGGAVVSDLHANWIVNEAREASAEDVRRLISLCQQEVLTRFSISLEPEIRFA